MSRKPSLFVSAAVLCISIIACSTPGLVTPSIPTIISLPTLAVSQPTLDQLTQQGQFTSIYTRANPGVVSILTTTDVGSGWVYSADGYIVTNDHVVNG
jgi:S1-C subfamily serine protease